MKFRIKLKLILVLLIVIFIALSIPFILEKIKPVTTIVYNKNPYVFREDVREAYKISVYPDEQFVYDLLWNYRIKNITILFKPMDSPTNGLYAVEAFELTNKLSQIYATTPIMKAQILNQTHNIYLKRNFTAQQIEDYSNIKREDDVLKIVLVAPQFSNKTSVLGGGNKIFIYGKDKKDFDLATIRLIEVAMKFSPEKFSQKTT
jgi:hypothetical protein